MYRYLTTIVFFIVIALFWEWMTGFNHDLRFVLPGPRTILHTLYLKKSMLLWHTFSSAKIMLAGMILAFFAAFICAWVMASSRQMSQMMQPAFVMLKCIPMFTLAPIMVIWWGWSAMAQVVPTAMTIFFPLTLSIYQGLRSVPAAYIDFFRLNQATPFQIFQKLQLPWAQPSLFSGLKISAALAGVSTIAGEWAGAQHGLGILMLESRNNSDLNVTFAALVCLIGLSLTLYGMIVLLEKWMHPSNKSLFKRTALVFSLLIVSLTVFLGEQTKVKPTENMTRLMLDWLPNPNHIPLFVGVERGFFKKKGIDLYLHKVHDPGDPIPALISGITDLSVSYMPTVMRAQAMDADIKVVATVIDVPLNCILYRKDREIHSIQDLNGKEIGYCSGTKGSAALARILALNGISPMQSRNVNFDLISMLATGHVDAVYGACWNIQPSQLQSLGISTAYFHLSELQVPAYQEMIIVSRAKSDQSAMPFVRSFQEAMNESIVFCRESPEVAFDIYRKANLQKSEETLAWELESWKKTMPVLTKTQELDEKALTVFADWLYERGLLSQRLNAKSLIPE